MDKSFVISGLNMKNLAKSNVEMETTQTIEYTENFSNTCDINKIILLLLFIFIIFNLIKISK